MITHFCCSNRPLIELGVEDKGRLVKVQHGYEHRSCIPSQIFILVKQKWRRSTEYPTARLCLCAPNLHIRLLPPSAYSLCWMDLLRLIYCTHCVHLVTPSDGLCPSGPFDLAEAVVWVVSTPQTYTIHLRAQWGNSCLLIVCNFMPDVHICLSRYRGTGYILCEKYNKKKTVKICCTSKHL